MYTEITYDYVLPVWSVCPLVYGDYSALSDKEEETIVTFIENLPEGPGVWSFDDEVSSAAFNDITRYVGDDVRKAIYTVLEA